MRSRARRSHANFVYSRRLRIESLEDRRLLAGVVVSNTSDLVIGNTTSIAGLMVNNGGRRHLAARGDPGRERHRISDYQPADAIP